MPTTAVQFVRQLISLAVLLLAGSGLAQDKSPSDATDAKLMKHQITGLFCPERVQDFKDLCEQKLSKYKLVRIDYDNAEATFDYDPATAFPGAKPEQVIERLHNEVSQASRSTFGIKPLRAIPKEKLKREEFGIVGLDCKACSLAVYEIIYRLPGVEQANASFKSGKAIALINLDKIDRVTIETALKQRGVTLTP